MKLAVGDLSFDGIGWLTSGTHNPEKKPVSFYVTCTITTIEEAGTEGCAKVVLAERRRTRQANGGKWRPSGSGYGGGAAQHNSNHRGFSHPFSSSQLKFVAAARPPWHGSNFGPTEAARRNYYTQCLLDVLSHATVQEIQDCFSHNIHSAHKPPSKHAKKVCLNMLVMRSHAPGEVRIECLTGKSMGDSTISDLEHFWPSAKASFPPSHMFNHPPTIRTLSVHPPTPLPPGLTPWPQLFPKAVALRRLFVTNAATQSARTCAAGRERRHSKPPSPLLHPPPISRRLCYCGLPPTSLPP